MRGREVTRAWRGGLAALLCAALGCGDSSASGENDAGERDAGESDAGSADAALANDPDAGTFSEVYALMFPAATAPRCDFCHAMPANAVSNGLLHTGMDKASAYAALVDKTSASKACSGRVLVKPGDPDKSLFYQKLTADVPCGARMPLGGAALGDPALARVRSWITNGARDD